MTSPDIYKLASAYSGPILFVSNYDSGKLVTATIIKEVIDGFIRDGRKSIRAIISLKYIVILGQMSIQKWVFVHPGVEAITV
jgi:hypothetical protein